MSDHLHALPQGTILEGYHIERILGVGGFGITYLARDTDELGKYFAIKEYLPNEYAVRSEASTVLPKSSGDKDDYEWGLERFLDEAKTLAAFDHANLNTVFRFFRANGTAYMVLEYIEGETLSAKLKRDKTLTEHELNTLLHALTSGLEEVHRAGFVHRDIKPGNIMIKPDGSPILLDFGAARAAIGQRSKSITAILTPGYAPVEQYDISADDIGPWTDIYAIGMVAYKCITGCKDSELIDAVARSRLQRKNQSDQDLAPAIQKGRGRYNDDVLKGIDWAIQINEEDRPQSISEWMPTLFAAQNETRTQAHAAPVTHATVNPTAKDRSSSSMPIFALIATIIIAVGLGYWYLENKTFAPDNMSAGLTAGKIPDVTPARVPDAGKVPPPLVGHLQINTNVQATVEVDGNVIGTAGPGQPVNKKGLLLGAHDISISAAGYQSKLQTIQIKANDWTQVAITLQPEIKIGRVTVRSNVSRDKLYIDGELLGGTSSKAHELSPGNHTIRVEKSGYLPYEKTITVAKGEEKTVRAILNISPELYKKGLAAYNKRDYAAALKIFRPLANQGHASAQNKLGFMFQKGLGLDADLEKAVYWYRKAANQGLTIGQFNLGYMYENGLGFDSRNYTQAGYWYRKAANQGHASSQFNLGWLYQKGKGVTKDNRKAIKWYRKAANNGHVSAQNNMGWMYQNGFGVSRDYSQAISWYKKAANKNNPSAQFNLGWMYRNGLGVSKNNESAVLWYKKAAKQGNTNAQYRLGDMYRNGYGVTKDNSQAVYWYKKAAKKGHATTQATLGYMYRKGYGVTQSNKDAVYWYRKSAVQGNAKGQNNLGFMYQNGYGISRDYTQAVYWYRKSANQGYASGQLNLGYMYLKGYGLSKNKQQAKYWFEKSAAQGNKNAKSFLKKL